MRTMTFILDLRLTNHSFEIRKAVAVTAVRCQAVEAFDAAQPTAKNQNASTVNQASRPMEDTARAMGDSPRWFQLYWSTSNELVESLVSRAERCGCSAIVLTLDTTMLGWRIRDLDLAYLPFLRGKGIAQYTSDPVFIAALQETLRQESPPSGRITLSSIGTLLAQAGSYPGSRFANVRSGLARAAVRRFVETYSRPSL